MLRIRTASGPADLCGAAATPGGLPGTESPDFFGGHHSDDLFHYWEHRGPAGPLLLPDTRKLVSGPSQQGPIAAPSTPWRGVTGPFSAVQEFVCALK